MAVVLLCCVGCDQVTKSIARENLASSGPIAFLHDTFRLQYAENSGAFLSLGETVANRTHFPLAAIVTGIIVIGVLIYILMAKGLTGSKTIALSLLLAGGLGNLIDRLHNDGRVIARPSSMVVESGFSHQTSLPASQAMIEGIACQWSGVEMTTASTSLLPIISRKSWCVET